MTASHSTAHPLEFTIRDSTERDIMDMKILLVGLLILVPVWSCKMHRCYDENELDKAAQRKLDSHYPQPADPSPAADPDSPVTCPVELYRHQPPQDLSGRSLAPWRYVDRTMKDHYPETYVEAQCLCSGCILVEDIPGDGKGPILKESHDYNSYPIKQSRVFLKRELCSKKNTYSLTPVAHEVTVGCTCVRTNTGS